MPETTSEFASLPADDLSRGLSLAQLDSPVARHIGLVGDTYTLHLRTELWVIESRMPRLRTRGFIGL